jgi:hydrophobic/amphiphilic exporter-1 (mainly G- bacteria), HAE1 family
VNLSDVSIRRPVFATMMIVALFVFGLLAYPRIGVDLFPEAEFPIVTVVVVYPGGDPETMESKVADPIEEELRSLAGIDMLTSRSVEGLTQVIIQFELEVQVDQALQEVRDKVAALENELPAGIEPPLVQKFDIGAAPIMGLAVSGAIPAGELADIADDVKERIERVTGVGGVDLVGNQEREIQILVDPAKLTTFGLTVDDVAGALQAQSLDLPAGFAKSGGREFSVKTKGEVRTPTEIGDVLLPGAPGTTVRIRDVAQVLDTIEEARSATMLDAESAVGLIVRKQSGANTVGVAQSVRAVVAELEPELAKKNVAISVPNDTAVFIEHSIHDVQFDLVFGAGLTVLIIFLFLSDMRATFISALALPTSVVGTFAVMDLMGFTFNNLTMLALSLSIGILVDDAIVVIENIHRHLEQGQDRRTAAAEATKEITLAVLATTLSIVAVFVPVAIMKGLIGRFFFQFGITVAVAVLLSMFVSFSLTPLLSSRILRSAHGKRGLWTRFMDWSMGGLANGYGHLLRSSLRHPVVVIIVAIGAFVGAVALLARVPVEFAPADDRGQFAIVVEAPVGTSVDVTREVVAAIADDVRENLPGVVTTFATVGDANGSEVHRGRVEVALTPSKQREYSQEQLMAWTRERFADQPVEVTVEIIAAVGAGQSQAPIQFVLMGEDIATLTAAAESLAAELKELPGYVDVDTTARAGKPELAVQIDRDRAADLGVPVATIARAIRALVAGDPVGELREPGGTADVVLRMPDEQRDRIEALPNIQVRSSSGMLVDLASIVTVQRGEGPSEIARLDSRRQITVLANLEGVALGDAMTKVSEVAAKHVPPEIDTRFIGMVEIMTESFGYMVLALALAVVLVYMILAAQFDSFLQPIAIMLSLPLSFVGAFGALFLSGMTMNIFSMIGLIMLMGLVTKNAILLVDFTNAARAKGMEIVDALVEGGRVRLRPILMTTAAMIFGMLPVAMAISEGGEARAPMGVAVIGGLLTSTLLTLIVVPVVYLLFERLSSARFVRWIGRKLVGTEPAPPVATPAE